MLAQKLPPFLPHTHHVTDYNLLNLPHFSNMALFLRSQITGQVHARVATKVWDVATAVARGFSIFEATLIRAFISNVRFCLHETFRFHEIPAIFASEGVGARA
jgi:hypothetical protein